MATKLSHLLYVFILGLCVIKSTVGYSLDGTWTIDPTSLNKTPTTNGTIVDF